jgi:tetratricopeptide (TPR) repeat protein
MTSATARSLCDQGLALHAAGRIVEAAERYEAALAVDPQQFDALHMLGVARFQSGDGGGAAALLARAVRLAPDVAAAHSHLGMALTLLGRLDEAALSCERAAALEPDNAEARVNLGNALMALGRAEPALTHYERAAALRPDYAEAHYNRANALRSLGELDAALAGYDAALALRPAYVEALANRAATLLALRRAEDALAGYEAAIALAPGVAELHAGRARALNDLKRSEAALASCAQAIALKPTLVEALDNQAIALFDLRRLDEAVAACDRAIALSPGRAEAYNNRGMALNDLKRHGEALADYERALALRPDFAEAHLNRAMCLLGLGDLRGGFEAYHWRWRPHSPWRLQRPRADCPEWAGEDPAGKRVLVHCEQGFGDSLQFVRYLPMLAARGARVTLLAQPALVGLFRSIPGIEVAATLDGEARFDFQIAMMCLPRLFATTLETIPAATPYLAADPAKVAAWSARLANPASELRVGLVWAGDPRRADPAANLLDRRRSLALAQLAPLGTAPGVRFISLQKGEPAAEARRPPPGLVLDDFTDELGDFADTAALVTALDLVITVDTAAAHLAGALGKPVWILSRHDGCWRWLNGREHSPWYPSARLYHQRAAGAWDEVVARVARDLAAARPAGAGP